MKYTPKEVIEQIVQILRSSESYGNRPLWKEFFLSDAFLDVFPREDFIPALVNVLTGMEEDFFLNLDSVFLQELSLVFQITADMALTCHWEKDESRMELLRLLYGQNDPECLIWTEDARIVDRSDAFYDLARLVRQAEEGTLPVCERETWGNLAYCKEEQYQADPLSGEEMFPEDFTVHWEETLTREEIMEPDSQTTVRMHTWLVRRYPLSEDICLSMWENYEIEGRLGGYELCSYEPALQEMERLYPDLKKTEEGERIIWKKEFLQFEERLSPDPADLFSRPVFSACKEQPEFLQWMIHCLRCRRPSEELLKMLFACYMEKESNEPDRQVFLELLAGHLSWYERQEEEKREVFPEPEELEITLDNLHFWTSFFQTAYPFSSDKKDWPRGDLHRLLHCYMEQVYHPSPVWRMAFTGYDREKERITVPKSVQFSLGERQVKIQFGMHHVEYWIEEEPVYEPWIPFSLLAVLDGSEEELLHFFLLLPMALIKEEEQETARDVILKRMRFLPLHSFSHSYLTDCLLDQEDWPKPDKDQKKRIRRRCYSENAVYCFRSSLYLGKLTAEVLSPGGWKPLDLSAAGIPEELKKNAYRQIPGWEGILQSGSMERLYRLPDKKARWAILQKMTDSYLPPLTTEIKVFPAKGAREQKTALVRRAIAESLRQGASGYQDQCWIHNRGMESFLKEDLLGQWVYTSGNVRLHFDTKDHSRLSKVFYFTASVAWNPEKVVLSITGKQKKDGILQEKRLLRRVCQGYSMKDWGGTPVKDLKNLFTVCGYFMVEGERPFPIGISDEGRFYTFFDHRLIEADSFQRLWQASLDLSSLTAVSCCRGRRTTCRLNGRPELWYEYQNTYEDGNYPVGIFRQLMKEG